MRVLDRLWSRGEPALRTNLQAATNLSYDGLVRYLKWLEERGLVVSEVGADGKTLVRITPRGVEAYRQFIEWVADFAERKMGPTR